MLGFRFFGCRGRVQVALKGTVNAIIQEFVELHGAFLDLLLKTCDFLMHVLVCSGILDELKPDRSCVETDINELEAKLL